MELEQDLAVDDRTNEIDDKAQDEATGLDEGISLVDELGEGEQQGNNSQLEESDEAGQTADTSQDDGAGDDLGSSDEGDEASGGALESLEVEVVVRGSEAMVFGDEVAIQVFIDSLAIPELKTAAIGGNLARILDQQLKNSGALVQGMAEISENSGRFVRLTKETLEGIKEFGLVDTDVPGIKHVMLGTRGNIKEWAQMEVGIRSKLLNPAMLSGVGGIMTQLATQQSMAEITAYVKKIDQKLDVVIRKIDQTKKSDLEGFLKTLREATLRYEREGVVDTRFMNEIISFQNTVNVVESYAWDQIFGIVNDLPKQGGIKKVQAATDSAHHEISQWLGVLAKVYLAECLLDDFKLREKLEESIEAYNEELETLCELRADRVRKRVKRTANLGKVAFDVARYAERKRVTNQARALELHQQANDILELTYDFDEATQLSVNRKAIPLAEQSKLQESTSNFIQTQRDELPEKALRFVIVKGIRYMILARRRGRL